LREYALGCAFIVEGGRALMIKYKISVPRSGIRSSTGVAAIGSADPIVLTDLFGRPSAAGASRRLRFDRENTMANAYPL